MEFRWFGLPKARAGEDLDAATEAFMAALKPEGRVWNPFAERMARSEFRDRVQAAARGELVPVDEVKPVDVRYPPPLYEIRWQGISVTDRIGDGLVHSTALVRMYHSEPSRVPDHFIGHHVHEKLLNVDDINDEQNFEIRVAKRLYDLGESDNWGIVPSTGTV